MVSRLFEYHCRDTSSIEMHSSNSWWMDGICCGCVGFDKNMKLLEYESSSCGGYGVVCVVNNRYGKLQRLVKSWDTLCWYGTFLF